MLFIDVVMIFVGVGFLIVVGWLIGEFIHWLGGDYET